MSNSLPKVNTINNAVHFLSMISPKRFLNKLTWIDIGKSLYNVTKGSTSGDRSGLSVWIAYTHMALDNEEVPAFIASSVGDTCNALYPTFNTSSLTLKTLAWYAKCDSPENYQKWHDEWCNEALEASLDVMDGNVAEFLYRIYWLNTGYSERHWYQFKNDKWRKSSPNFCQKIIHSVISRYEIYSKRNPEKSQVIEVIINKLLTVTFRSDILTNASNMFHSEFDINYNTLGVTNGVLEAVDQNILFRHAKPEDYISISTNVPYNDKFSWEHVHVRTCMDLFRSFLVDAPSLHNFLKIMSTTLTSVYNSRTVHALKGTDIRLKQFIVTLLKEVYDDYFVSGTFDIPYEKFYTFKGKRVAFHDCDDDHSLDKLHVKMLVGGDSFCSRNGYVVTISPVVFLTYTNTINIPNCDKATIMRLNLVNLPGSCDQDFDQIADLASAFLWIMTQYYPIYVTEGLNHNPIDPNDIIPDAVATSDVVIPDAIATPDVDIPVPPRSTCSIM